MGHVLAHRRARRRLGCCLLHRTPASPNEMTDQLIRFVERGRMKGVVLGAIASWEHEHKSLPGDIKSGLSKRITGQVQGAIRGLLGMAPMPRFNGRERHCPTCTCGE